MLKAFKHGEIFEYSDMFGYYAQFEVENKCDEPIEVCWSSYTSINDYQVNACLLYTSCSGKKVCGILTEMSAEMEYINYIVIGIGINVNTKEFPEEISGVAVSLFQENPKTYHRAQIISDVLKAFEGYYESFLKTEDLTYLTERYGQYLININRQVRIVEKDSEFIGTARGINNLSLIHI